MATITDLPRPASIDGPTDPDLAPLWALAVNKFEVMAGGPPATRADWRQVVSAYSQLLGKFRGSLGQIIQERCAEAPGGD